MMGEVVQFPRAASRAVERWVTKRELAHHLGVSERWIEERVKHDGLPRKKDAHSRLVRFNIPAVEAWLDERWTA